jgi:hypothetical protein
MIRMLTGLVAAGTLQAAAQDQFNGSFFDGVGDVSFLGLLDIARR